MVEENNSLKSTVLFVDDEGSLIENLKIKFEDEFNVLTAKNAAEAFKILSENKDVKVVVSDQKMPGKSGTDLLGEVKNEFSDIVRIMCTGFPEFDISYKAIKDGYVYDFIVKKGSYFDELRKGIIKAVEWYKVQKEMKRLRNFVRQFEGTEIIQLGRSVLSMQDIMVRVADYDENVRKTVDKYYIKVEKYTNSLFGILNNKEPSDSVKGMDYHIFMYDRLLDTANLSKVLGDFASSDIYKNEMAGRHIKLKDLQNRIRKINNSVPANQLGEMIHFFELGSIIIQSKNKILHIQQHPNEIRHLVFVKGDDEKIILREAAGIDGETIEVKQEGDYGTAYDARGNTLGEPEQFLEIMLKKLKFAS
ncbi:MAG: response regulator [bacterium]